MYEAVSASTPNRRAGSPLTFKPLTVILASLLATAVIATVGSLSEVSLGDENYHVRQARAYAEQGRRVPYGPLFSSVDDRAPLPFNAAPLWHGGLAVLWRLIGSPSQIVAQIYQAGFYLLLLLSVYFGVRQIWNDSAASWAWLLIATMPMVCVYSILLYQDIPGIAVSALALLLLWRKNFLWAGVCLAAAYLVKMNMLSYAPWAVVFAAWWARGTWKRRLTAAALVAAPVVLSFAGDYLWRLKTYGSMTGVDVGNLSDLPAGVMAAIQANPNSVVIWNPDSIFDLRALVRHTGVPVLLAMCAAVVWAWDSISKWVWVCAALALAGFIYFMAIPGYPQVRYVMPIFLVLILLCGRGIAHWRPPRAITAIIIVVCLAQAVTACAYTYHQRQISKWDRAAYTWMRENTPKNMRIVCPELVLTNQTARQVIWARINPAFFMTEATDEQRQQLLTWFRVSYIAIPLRRIYDREKEGDHGGGYARDFVEKAQSLPYLKKVYENPGFIIFEFNCQE
ncbi:MAG: glycosyltransferase family 39 protein [Phycisphaerae bacterium]